MSIATVEHISKTWIRIHVDEHYEATVFNIRNAEIECVVVSKDGQEAARCRVAPPAEDERVEIDKAQDGSVVDIKYVKV